jgi:Domain of unknown function (DUF4864)
MDPEGGPLGEPAEERGPAVPEPAIAPPVWRPAFELERHRRRALLRRLAALLGTGTVAFTITTWFLLRRESHAPRLAAYVARPGARDETPKRGGSDEAAESSALKTARAQLQALNDGDITGAYAEFSPRYRARVPLATFRRLVTAHRDMFHTEEQDVTTRSKAEDRVVLDIHLSSDDDEEYIAEFTLVRLQGKWCVDDLRWALDESDTHSSA